MKQHKNLIVIMVSVIGAIILGYLLQSNHTDSMRNIFALSDTSEAIIHQEVLAQSEVPVEITKLYRDKKLVGILSNEKELDKKFNTVYKDEYEAFFPNSKLSYKDDLLKVKELSFNKYENKDEDIFEYLHSEKLFAIEAFRVSFSNGAIIYVQNQQDFDKARDTFVRNFTDEETFESIKTNTKIPPIQDYGTKDMNIEIAETVNITKGLASVDQILKNEQEILTFLSYGYDPKIETYTVQPYDTLQGIGWFHGIDPRQIVYINSDKLTDVNQVLKEGMELRVSKFNSPLSVTLTRERKASETILPDSIIYESDSELEEGKEIVDVVERNGRRDVVYEDKLLNGAPISSVEKSSKTIEEPIRGKVRVGTKIEPRIGSGNYRWPLDNANISCVYGNSCYAGHNGTDFVLNGGGYGPIYAIDRGVVSESNGGCLPGNGSCGKGWGNYIIIDHGNGYSSLYAHMATTPYFHEGQIVKRGDNIGYMGLTGITYGPHVHLEIRFHGVRVDPCSVMGC